MCIASVLMPDIVQADRPRQPAAEHFYSGALLPHPPLHGGARAVVDCGSLVEVWLAPRRGFAFGCAIAYLNFYWLKRVIVGFADRATGDRTSQSGQGIVFRFLLRYVLMALGAYVILTVSPASLNGLLAGLFLPVAAIGCEACL